MPINLPLLSRLALSLVIGVPLLPPPADRTQEPVLPHFSTAALQPRAAFFPHPGLTEKISERTLHEMAEDLRLPGIAAETPWGRHYQSLRHQGLHDVADHFGTAKIPGLETTHYVERRLEEAMAQAVTHRPWAEASSLARETVALLIDPWLHDHSVSLMGLSAQKRRLSERQTAAMKRALESWLVPVQALLKDHYANPLDPEIFAALLSAALAEVTALHAAHNAAVFRRWRQQQERFQLKQDQENELARAWETYRDPPTGHGTVIRCSIWDRISIGFDATLDLHPISERMARLVLVSSSLDGAAIEIPFLWEWDSSAEGFSALGLEGRRYFFEIWLARTVTEALWVCVRIPDADPRIVPIRREVRPRSTPAAAPQPPIERPVLGLSPLAPEVKQDVRVASQPPHARAMALVVWDDEMIARSGSIIKIGNVSLTVITVRKNGFAAQWDFQRSRKRRRFSAVPYHELWESKRETLYFRTEPEGPSLYFTVVARRTGDNEVALLFQNSQSAPANDPAIVTSPAEPITEALPVLEIPEHPLEGQIRKLGRLIDIQAKDEALAFASELWAACDETISAKLVRKIGAYYLGLLKKGHLAGIVRDTMKRLREQESSQAHLRADA